MTSLTAPPIYSPLIDDPTDPVAGLPWILFFNQVYSGDLGQQWNPTFTGLTVSGAAPTITGNFYQITQALLAFTVRIVPATGSSTTSTAGTTYINNFPLRMNGDGIVFAVSGLLGTNSGQCEFATNRVYPPSWSAVTIPLTLFGFVEAS